LETKFNLRRRQTFGKLEMSEANIELQIRSTFDWNKLWQLMAQLSHSKKYYDIKLKLINYKILIYFNF